MGRRKDKAQAKSDSEGGSEKGGPLATYEEQVAELMEMAAMSQTPGWARLYNELREEQRMHQRSLETVEKPVEIHKHQAGLAALRDVVARVARAPQRIKELRRDFPLFAAHMPVTGEWDGAAGVLTVSKVPATKDAAA